MKRNRKFLFGTRLSRSGPRECLPDNSPCRQREQQHHHQQSRRRVLDAIDRHSVTVANQAWIYIPCPSAVAPVGPGAVAQFPETGVNHGTNK